MFVTHNKLCVPKRMAYYAHVVIYIDEEQRNDHVNRMYKFEFEILITMHQPKTSVEKKESSSTTEGKKKRFSTSTCIQYPVWHIPFIPIVKFKVYRFYFIHSKLAWVIMLLQIYWKDASGCYVIIRFTFLVNENSSSNKNQWRPIIAIQKNAIIIIVLWCFVA